MNWSDSTAIADAAGLHAMTKLEFDKAARGSGAAVAGEYAGGSTRIAANRGFAGAHGSGSERATPADANTSWSPSLQDRQLLGPYSASLAAERATREGCGESYWGVVNLSGNLVELVDMPACRAAPQTFRTTATANWPKMATPTWRAGRESKRCKLPPARTLCHAPLARGAAAHARYSAC